MKPFNRLFILIYYVVGFVARVLHPTSVEIGRASCRERVLAGV